MPNYTFKLEVTVEDVRLIAAGLAELPFKFVSPLIAKLDQQLLDQQQPQVKEESKDG